MGITLDKLVFDTTVPDNGANVGAYLRAADGALINATSNALHVHIASSTGLGIFAEDAAHTTGDLGQQILAVRNDAGTALAGASGDYIPLSTDASGNLRVTGGITYAEDAAHTSGDSGNYVLSVRQDTLSASASADGDYQSFKTDAFGRQWMSFAKQSGAYAAVSVGNTATDLIGTDLANRTMVILQNVSNRDVFVGTNASVTTSNGIRLAAGASMEIPVTSAVNLHGITSSGTADVRTLELV
jgi:hypothetical protein